MAIHQDANGNYVDDQGNIVGGPGGGYDPRYAPGMPTPPPQGVTADDLKYISDPNTPTQYDPAKGMYYRTSYDGTKNYLPSSPRPSNTFAHTYSWDPLTGTWQASLNGGGLGGALTGAAAVAGPAVLGPMLTGSASLFGGAAPEITASTAPYDPGFLPTTSGAAGSLPSASLAGIPGMTGAAPSVAGAADTAAGAGGGGSLLGTLGNAFTGGNALKNIGALTSLIPLIAAARGGSGGGSGSFAYPQLGQLLNSEVGRVQAADPLAPMVSKLAASRMPITAK